jgi:hypothetical protein
MAQNLDLNINVNTDQAAKSVGSLKSQLREAQAEVASLADKFGATSKEAIEAAKRAAELKDRIGDAKALTEAFNPDAKFKALTASLSGVAGGFAAVQGAMALFGNESEDLQKTLVKVQSAMALSQGLQAVGESIDSFKQLGAVIKTQVVTAFSTLRGAIIATGVGALAIGVGLLIANFDKVKETLTNLFPGLIKFGNQIKNLVQGITDFVGITSKAARAQDNLKSSLETSNKQIDNQIKILEAQGGKEDEIYKKKRERINNQIKLIKGSTQQEKQARADLNTELQVLDLNEANRIKKANEDAAKERKAETEKRNKENQEAREKAEAQEKEAQEKIQKDLLQSYEDYLKRREFARKNSEGLYQEDIRKFEQEDAEERDKKRNEEIDKNVIAQNKAIANIKLTGVQILAIDQANADARAKITEEERNLRVNAAYDIADAALSLGSIIGEQTKAGKALGVATALINTYVGASEVIRAKSTIPEPFGTIQKIASVAAILATGFRAVKSITAVQVPGGGGGGGASVPSISTQAPITPQLPSAQMTQLNTQTINDLGNQAVRAYVIETDVTSNQERMAAIRQRARFT